MQCSAVQCSAVQCSAMQCMAMQCNAMQCNAMQCNAMQCNAMQCNAMQCNAMQCNAMQRIKYNPNKHLSCLTDTAYSERFMGFATPGDNKAGYEVRSTPTFGRRYECYSICDQYLFVTLDVVS